MKKYIFTFFLLVSFIFSGQSQVLIGNGTATSGQFTPFKPYYAYTYSQSIYLNSEINASGTITSIQWYFDGTTAIPFSDQITVYLGTTTKTSFASTSDWIPVANMTKVFEGKIIMDSPTGKGWKTVTFTTPFVYDGTKNLVIATDENTPGSDPFNGGEQNPDSSLNQNFYNFATGDNRSIYAVNGTTNIDPTSPPVANNLKAFVPNIIIGGIAPACETPQNLTVNAITQTTATVRWVDLAGSTPINGSEYYVTTLSNIPTENTTPTGSITTGVSADLINLSPGTTYYVYVRNSCASEKSPWSPANLFTTLCANSVTDFYENFDNLNTRPDSSLLGNLTNCWSRILRPNNGTLCPSARVRSASGGNAYSPTNYISMSNCNSTDNYDIILVTPQVSNLNNSPNRLIFYSKGGVVEVGTLDKNTDDAVFTVYKTYTTYTTDAYSKYEIEFKNYLGTDKYIGIRLKTSNDQQISVSIDDVSWSFNPTCPDVTEVNVPSVTDVTATIGWSDGADATSWDITYGAPFVTDPNSLPYFTSEDSGTYTLTDLQPGTQYKAWVRSVCDGNNKGAYIGPVLFTTNCATDTTFNEDFNSTPIGALPGCWGKILRANSGTLLPTANVSTTDYDIYNATKCVTLSSGNSEGNFDVILVSPKVSTLAAGSNYRLRFRSRFSSKTVEVGTLSSSTDSAVFTLFQTVQFNETGAKEEYKVDFSSYNGTDEYIAFRMPNVPGQGFSGISLDNIIWEPVPSCPEVTDVAVISTSETSATVNWMSTPAESSWDVSYGPTTATDPDADNLPIFNTNSYPYIVQGLSIGTTYNVWVRANCDGEGKGTGAWIGPVQFSTECDGVSSFIERFDDPLTTTLPNMTTCWTKILRGPVLSQYATITTNKIIYPEFLLPPHKLSAPNCVIMNAQGSSKEADLILVSPKLNNMRGKNRLKFDSEYPGRVQIGTLDNNTNSAKFTVITEFLLKTTIVNGTFYNEPTVVNITDYSGSDTHIGIRLMPNPNIWAEPDPEHPDDFVPGFPSIYIDNVVWEPIPGCIEVSDVKVTGKTTTTATATWTKGQNETNWDVVYSATETNPDLISPIVTVTGSPTTTLTNLTPGMTYNLWVRANCGDSNSAWVGPVLFTTECLSTNIPYFEDFNSSIVPDMPNCTTETKIGFGSNWQTADIRPGNDYTYDSKKLQYQGDFSETANAWFFTQGINLTQGTEYTISFKYGSDSNAAILFNSLGVMYGTSNTPDGMTLPLADYPAYYGFDNKAKIDFTAPTTGIYYFGFNAYSAPGQGYMFLDNIVIDTKLSNNEFDINQFSYYPNPVKDVLNISYIKDISSVTVYNLLGQKVLVNNLKNNNPRIDMSTLSKGTYMVKVVSDNQTKTIKVIKE